MGLQFRGFVIEEKAGLLAFHQEGLIFLLREQGRSFMKAGLVSAAL